MRRDNEDPVQCVRSAVQGALAALVPANATIAIALSGGRDSVVLLDALCATAPAGDHLLHAIHVHHGLSQHATDWQLFCEELCATRRVPLTVRMVEVPRRAQASLENDARRLRYAALAEAAHAVDARFVALAHHRDDQAETLVLQLLRGAGPHGLAAMSELRQDARGVTWWRPLLDVSRASIDTYASTAGLRWVDDESNADTRHRRNAVRHRVMPVLTEVAADAAATLARAAAHQAEAAHLADDLAALDAAAALDGDTLDRAALAALPGHRARNVLRWFLRQRDLPAPSTARLAAMLAQLTQARGDARVRLAHAGVELGVHRGRIVVHAPSPPPFAMAWDIHAELALPHGRLVATRVEGDGVDLARIGSVPLTVRSREGGERLSLGRNRPHRPLKVILQDAGMPVWDRQSLPLVYCGTDLVVVPGIGVAAEWQCAAGAPGITVAWHPAAI